VRVGTTVYVTVMESPADKRKCPLVAPVGIPTPFLLIEIALTVPPTTYTSMGKVKGFTRATPERGTAMEGIRGLVETKV
jgi:hypothetical protein